MKDLYFERYAYPVRFFEDEELKEDASIVIAIPSFKERETHNAVLSLLNCDKPKGKVYILVLVNEPENSESSIQDINQETLNSIKAITVPYGFSLRVTFASFPAKKAGVGLARKVLMDEATRFFDSKGKPGIIICFDADCTCPTNFLVAIEECFKNTDIKAAINFFEHPLDHTSIIQYELFLRYYVDAQRYAGHPYAYQTLGSCIAVKSDIYKKVGGMNTRKAGEDFYFLQKLIPMKGFVELNSTTIYPSSRKSDRVPFGTGFAITKIQKEQTYGVYDFRTFQDLRRLIVQAPKFFDSNTRIDLPVSVVAFHQVNGFENALEKMIRNSGKQESFMKHFWQWWDGFRVLKFTHFARDHFYPNVRLEDALSELNKCYWQIPMQTEELKPFLLEVREFDRSWIKGS